MIELGSDLDLGSYRMAQIKVVDDGCLSSLAALRAGWLQIVAYGLFQNDWTPDEASTIAEVTPCTFSGYAGLLMPTGWSVPVLEGFRAVTRATIISWAHNGGPVGNWVYGYYVVDPLGALVLAQRFADAPGLVERNGVAVSVTPTFSVRSEF